MKRNLTLTLFAVAIYLSGTGQEMSQAITLKSPGNPATRYELTSAADLSLKATQEIPADIQQNVITAGNLTRVEVTITAKDKIYFNFEKTYKIDDYKHNDSEFLMPGFWYHKNLRSPKEAPSFSTSDSWQVREDRLSTPLTGIFNSNSGSYYTVLRLDKAKQDAIAQHQTGEIILSSKTDLGFTGFKNENGLSALVFGFPYHEAPKSYIRKLTLVPEVMAFEKLEKGESRKLTWEISSGKAMDYSEFISKVWTYAYDKQKPEAVEAAYSNDEAKKIMTNFFKESYVSNYDLKYYSGVHLRTDDCEHTGSAEVGFVGRVLLNAYNALVFGETHGDQNLVDEVNASFSSYLEHR